MESLIYRAIVIGGLLFSAYLAAAPDCEKLKEAWQDPYKKDFGIRSSIGPDFDCPKPRSGKNKHSYKNNHSYKKLLSYQLAEAIYHLEKPEFKKHDIEPIPDFYKRTSKWIRKMTYEEPTEDSECEKNSVAMAVHQSGEVIICPGFIGMEPEFRASVFVHETLHLKRRDVGHHVKCKGGSYSGDEDGCDPRFSDLDFALLGMAGDDAASLNYMVWVTLDAETAVPNTDLYDPKHFGGYSASVEYLAWVLHGSDYHELRKDVLQSEINYLVPDRFNKIASEQTKRWRNE